jgi:hypothetical protein
MWLGRYALLPGVRRTSVTGTFESGRTCVASRIIVFITKAGQAESDGRYRAQINEVTVR